MVTAASAIAAGLRYRGELRTDSPLRLLYLAAAANAVGREHVARLGAADLDQLAAHLAQQFVDLVLSDQGQQVLRDAGFGKP